MADKLRKIGFVSTHFAINYGAVLQAYALQKTLRRLGHIVLTIDYRPTDPKYGRIERYSFTSIKDAVLSILRFLNLSYRRATARKLALFDAFVSENFVLTDQTYKTFGELKRDTFPVDTLVCGSDQIWNLNLIDDQAFYLAFGERTMKRIAYAASLGEQLTERQLAEVAHRVSSFDLISLREPEAVANLSALTGQTVSCVVDPVFLLDRADWMDIGALIRVPINKPYVFVYEVSSPEGFSDMAKSIATRLGLSLVVLSTRPYKKYTGSQEIIDVSPDELLALISGASFIVTSSFHGCALSALLNRPFLCSPSKTRSSRHRHLLSQLGLEHRLLTPGTFEPALLDEDWDAVNDRIHEVRSAGLDFLKRI